MRKVSFLFTFLFVMSALAYSQTGVSGRWDGVVPPNGDPITMVFNAEGTQLTGSLIKNYSYHQLREGKIDGDTITFSVRIQNNSALTVSFTGKVNRDEISFSAVSPIPPNPRQITVRRVR